MNKHSLDERIAEVGRKYGLPAPDMHFTPDIRRIIADVIESVTSLKGTDIEKHWDKYSLERQLGVKVTQAEIQANTKELLG